MKTTRRQIDEEDFKVWESKIDEPIYELSDVEQLQKEIENKEQILYRNPKNIGVVDIEDIREVFNNFKGK